MRYLRRVKTAITMAFVAVAIGASAVIGVGSAIASSSAASKAAGKAADATTEANQKNIEFSKWLYGEQKDNNTPWYDAGTGALKQIQQGIADGTFNPGVYSATKTYDPGTLNTSGIADPGAFNGLVDLNSDPGYQFRLQQGVNALDKSASSKGLLQSGAQAKAITGYGQNLASQEYQNAYDRAYQQYGSTVDQYGRKVAATTNDYNALVNQQNSLYNQDSQQKQLVYNSQVNNAGNQFNQLNTLNSIGQAAANNTNAAATNMGSAITNSNTNTGNVLANVATAQGNAAAQGIMGANASTQSMLGNYVYNNYLKKPNP